MGRVSLKINNKRLELCQFYFLVHLLLHTDIQNLSFCVLPSYYIFSSLERSTSFHIINLQYTFSSIPRICTIYIYG